MEYQEAVEYLLAIPKFAGKTSHDNLRGFLNKLQNPQDDIPAIHIAGTNGKGSTCAFLASILRQAGCRVGMFTSPHLIKVNERFQLDGEMISDRELVEMFCLVKNVVEEGIKEGLVHPNFFEFIFMMALCWYRRKNDVKKNGQGVDFVIYETGLGGRLDATNILKPCLTVITSIGLDHMQYLGDTIEQIAGEKAGILKPNTPCVYLSKPESACNVIEARGSQLNIPMISVETERISIQKNDGDRIDFRYQTKYDRECGRDTGEYHIRKTALYQLENAVLALEAGGYVLQHIWEKRYKVQDGEDREVLNLYECLQQGLSDMYWRGRMEEILPDFYVDGAHNEPAILAFCDTINRIYRDKKIILLFAVSCDKSYNEMIRILCSRISFDKVIVTAIGGVRTTPVSDVADIFSTYAACPVVCEGDLRVAFEAARELLNGENRVFCVGSLYLVGSILECVQKDIDRTI